MGESQAAGDAQSASRAQLFALLDEDVAGYSLADWRQRNLELYRMLAACGLVDTDIVSMQALEYLMGQLLHIRVGAATDPQNAGHVRAQNENILHFSLAAGAPPQTLTIALVAGYIHDLNKAFREPLRTDEFAVKDARGSVVPLMISMAEIIGLNHLGDRTRRELMTATKLGQGALEPGVAQAIDRCIVHHGLGSSRYIQELVAGENESWGDEFVDPSTGNVKLVHPPQPELTLASVLHDLADSAQQMQGGVAWLMKYPAGYWRGLGRSYGHMLSGTGRTGTATSTSLIMQVHVESETCRGIIEAGLKADVLTQTTADTLEVALQQSIAPSLAWVDDTPEALAPPDGLTVYHDVGTVLGVSPDQAKLRLEAALPGTVDADTLEDAIWASGRKLDSRRAGYLSQVIVPAS